MIHFSIVVFGKDLKRKVLFSLGDDLIPNAGYLKDCNLRITKEIIANLESVIRGEIRTYEWGGGQGRIYVTSYKSMSYLEDVICDQNLGEIPTKKLLSLMQKWRDFLESWSTGNRLNEVLSWAFTEIKENIENALITEGIPRYEIKTPDGKTNLNLVIEEETFQLSSDEYIEELGIDRSFLI